jgi:hypothetical protein
MTSPKHAKTTARGRQYINPVTGEAHPSVTTILGQIGKAEALKWWAAAETAKYAVTMRDTWIDLDEQAAIDLLKREPLRSLNRAADRGTDVHAIADNYATTGRPPEIGMHTGYVEAMLAFFAEHQPLPLLAEKTVYGSLGYAGSFDMVCRLPALDDAICILDYKTSKAIYPDTAAQLAAYANAEQYIDENDDLHPMMKVQTGVIVRFGANGEYEVQEADLDAGWQMFKAALDVYQAQAAKLLRGAVLAKHDYNLAGYRANILQRVTYIKDNNTAEFDRLRANWIAGLPPLSSEQPIQRHQLALLEAAIIDNEREMSAPFNPPPADAQINEPPRIKTPAPAVEELVDIEVASEEVELIRRVVNAATADVKNAVKTTTQEASAAKTTLSLSGKPTLRRVLIARMMLDCYTGDPTRVIMQGVLEHHGVYNNKDIGSSLGALDIGKISAIMETVKGINDGNVDIAYHGDTNSITITGANK